MEVIGDVRMGHSGHNGHSGHSGYSGPQSLSGCFGQNKYFLSILGIDIKCKAIVYRSNLCLCSAMTSWKVAIKLSLMASFACHPIKERSSRAHKEFYFL